MSQNGIASLSSEENKSNKEWEKLESRIKNGGGWFFWIAGLSIINSIIYLAGSDLTFIIGLGITQVIDGMASVATGQGKAIAFVITLIIAAVFVTLGIYSRKKKNWAFILGIVLYSFDALLFLIAQDWLSIGFHIFALVFIVMATIACFRSNNMGQVNQGL